MSRPIYDYDGSAHVTVECKGAFPGEGPCGMDLEVTQLANGALVLPPCCEDCGVEFDAESGGREWLIDAAKYIIDNDEPTEKELSDDFNAVSFTERVELENRDRWSGR